MSHGIACTVRQQTLSTSHVSHWCMHRIAQTII